MADQRSDGMIALIPADPDALAIEGGDPVDELHLTLVYLGDDVSGYSIDHRAALVDLVRDIAQPPLPPEDETLELAHHPRGPVETTVWAHAVFNPGPDAAIVYLAKDAYDPVNPDVELGRLNRWWLPDLQGRVAWRARDILGVLMATQHHPWQPHVTAGWAEQGIGADSLSYVGPVVFDRIRLALGGEVTDFPLVPAPVDQMPSELKFQSPDPRARRLAKYWARGKGRARWAPGTPGDYNRLRAALRKEIGPDMPQRVLDGLAANIHHMATGEWPGPKAHGGAKKGTKSVSEQGGGETKSLSDEDMDARLDHYADMEDGLTVEEIYDEAVEDDKSWDLEPDGNLTESEEEEEEDADGEPETDSAVADFIALFEDEDYIKEDGGAA